MSHQDENFMKVTWVKVKRHFEIFAMEIPIEKISHRLLLGKMS